MLPLQRERRPLKRSLMGDERSGDGAHDPETGDVISLEALSEEDLSHIADNPHYRSMLQDLLAPYLAGTSADSDPVGARGRERGTDPTTSESEAVETAPDTRPSRGGNTTAQRTPRRSCSREVTPPAAKRLRLGDPDSDTFSEASVSEVTPFDPSLDREDKEEFRCDVPDAVGQYLEKHFRRALSKEERTAMLRKHPKPDTAVMAPPKLDAFIMDFAPKKVDKARDAVLARIQGSLLYAANPLANLWANLVEQRLDSDSQAVVPVGEVLDTIQRSLVLLGNANTLMSERRREIALEAVHPSLKKYAKGDFSQAGADLFGDKFKEGLVEKVEADGVLSKAVRIVSWGTRVYQNP